MYVYRRSKSEQLFTVGFFAPDGSWEPESDHPDAETAAQRVSYLNGGLALKLIATIEAAIAQVMQR